VNSLAGELRPYFNSLFIS